WIGYNMARFNKPTLLSTGDGLALAGANQTRTYHGRLLGYIAFLEHLPRASDQSDLSQKLRRRAVDYALDHSDRWPAVVGARLGRRATRSPAAPQTASRMRSRLRNCGGESQSSARRSAIAAVSGWFEFSIAASYDANRTTAR